VSDPGAARSRHASTGLLALTAVLLASAAVGFIAYRLLQRPTTAYPAAMSLPSTARVPDTTITPEGPPLERPKVPEELPDIRLPGTDGVVHGLREFIGRPLVVNFWATWCDPCRREIPLLKTLRREHAGDRLEVVGIAVDHPDEVRKYAQAHGIDYPVLVGEEGGLEAAEAFGMDTVLPFSVFTDRQGRIVTLKVGELHPDEAELILTGVHEVDAGKLPIQAAREQISAGIRRLRMAHAAD
jgi:thiol-disulfide isomerase/thioredoxin